MLSRLRYYAASVLTLVTQIENPLAILNARNRSVIRLRNGARYIVRSFMDVWILKETCIDRDYETRGAKIGDGWTVIDIGAALGDFAVMTAKENPTCRVIAFEPFPESFKLLEQNIRLNRVENITALPIAIGSKSGSLTLSTTGEAVQHTTTESVVSGVATSAITVESLSLEDALKRCKIDTCDFLKMDCEGSEFDILLNTNAATLQRIKRICLEYHDGFTDHTHLDLKQHLERHGYQVKTSANPVHNFLGFLYAEHK
jgi:FkbM family methyltransferase